MMTIAEAMRKRAELLFQAADLVGSEQPWNAESLNEQQMRCLEASHGTMMELADLATKGTAGVAFTPVEKRNFNEAVEGVPVVRLDSKLAH